MIRNNMPGKGAYLLFLQVQKTADIEVGKLGKHRFPAGIYIYVGSASRGIETRVARHRRLAETKQGKIRWHVDFLLAHPEVRFTTACALEGSSECTVSQEVAHSKRVTIPVQGFGSSDCRTGCRTHFYQLHGEDIIGFVKSVAEKDG